MQKMPSLIMDAPNPTKTYAEMNGSKSKPKSKPKSQKTKKPKTKRDKQVSLLLTEEEYLFVSDLSDEQELSMTKIVRKFLSDKGFFND